MATTKHPGARVAGIAGVFIVTAIVTGILIWQAITAHGNPNPLANGLSRTTMIFDTGVLVFREGLEAILVLAALTASLTRTTEGYWKPVAAGASVSFVASFITWFIVVAIIASLGGGTPQRALDIQAGTGLLAIIVLLVVMNWFFHKLYWTGWIKVHNRRKQELIESTHSTQSAKTWGLFIIGFTSVYREGFELVLFLQDIRLKGGSTVVLEGFLIGLSLTLMVALLTFVLHYRLPYKKMLILTGVMLGVVLIVMVGEQVQEMQQAGWIPATALSFSIPDWMNQWFGIFPTAQSLISQASAILLVVGSYFLARQLGAAKNRPA